MRTLALILAASLLLALPARAENDPDSTFNVAVDVGYVVVPFAVTDERGRVVENLRASDVQLYVDGRRVSTDMFEQVGATPVSFTILFDGSGSMALAGKVQTARLAVRSLLGSARPGDDFSLHVFSEGTVREVVPFTTDTRLIQNAVDAIEPYGKTSFYDALARMPDESILGSNGARAIVLFTDALDNASSLTREGLTTLLEGVDVPVYAMGLRASRDPGLEKDRARQEHLTDLQTLERVAESSGGRVAIGAGAGEMIHAIRQMDRDLRSQYLVGFSPTGRGPVRFRPIEVRLARGLQNVRVRAGYRGTEAPMWTRGSARAGSK